MTRVPAGRGRGRCSPAVAFAVCFLAATVGMGSRAFAEDNLNQPPYAARRLSAVPIGAWARYKTAYYAGNTRQDLELALVARTAKQATWQIAFAGFKKDRIVVQILSGVSADAPGVLVKTIAQPGAGQAFEKSDSQAGTKPALRVASRKTRAAKESIVVPAGTFSCEHLTQTESAGHGYDFWISDQVLPTAIVRFEEWTRGGNGMRMVQRTWELMAVGRGARNEISGAVLPVQPVQPIAPVVNRR